MRRFRPILIAALFLAFLICHAPATAGNFISGDQVDFTKILAPPPANDSPQTRDEIQELLRLQEKRTPREAATVEADANATVFQVAVPVLGPGFTSWNLPQTAKFFERLGQDEGAVVSRAKDAWKRPRPFVLSKEIKPCLWLSKSGAYPSGHATYGYLTAIVLANLVPEKKADLFARAAQYSYHRMVGGVHYRTDIEAGRITGSVIAAFMMQHPDFKSDFLRVREEVRIFLKLP